jgi:hypothetical protein
MAKEQAANPKPLRRPLPDWGRRGTQPKGELGPKPGPNGQVVATQPKQSS